MSIEPQFLSFKGLRQYTPEDGWAEVNAMLNSRTNGASPAAPDAASNAASKETTSTPAQPFASPAVQHAMPDISLELDLPTLTETAEPPAPDAKANNSTSMFDPLISELVDQLKVPPTDELTQTWRTIAAEVNLLTQRMALQRELQERLHKLDLELTDLRGTIMSHLRDVQQAADQQLTSARLRAEVSALAQTKLTAKLNRRN
jgi:hypothetical protein